MSISEAADKDEVTFHKARHRVLHRYGFAVDGLSSACDMLVSFHTALATGCTITAAVSYASASQALHWPAWHRSGTSTCPPALVHLHSVATELLPSSISYSADTFQHPMQGVNFNCHQSAQDLMSSSATTVTHPVHGQPDAPAAISQPFAILFTGTCS